MKLGTVNSLQTPGAGTSVKRMTTDKQALLEAVYGAELRDHIKLWRKGGDSWRTISDRIAERHGVTVSHVSLSAWYRSDAAA